MHTDIKNFTSLCRYIGSYSNILYEPIMWPINMSNQEDIAPTMLTCNNSLAQHNIL